MSQPVRQAIVAAAGGVANASAAAGWGLWLTRGPAGWPDLGIPAQGSDALLFCASLMLVGLSLATLAQGLLATPPAAIAATETARPVRPRMASAVQLGVGAILLICLLPYVVGAPEWSPVAIVRRVLPGWSLLVVASLLATLSGAQCLRLALRAPAKPEAGT